MGAPTIPELAVTAGLSQLVKALEQFPDLVTALKGKGPFTVFAPNNAAFLAASAKYPAVFANTTAVKQVLEYHVAGVEKLSTDLSNNEKIKTLDIPQELTISKIGGTVKVNNATVTSANNLAVNGVVHIIDAVLVPPNLISPTAQFKLL